MCESRLCLSCVCGCTISSFPNGDLLLLPQWRCGGEWPLFDLLLSDLLSVFKDLFLRSPSCLRGSIFVHFKDMCMFLFISRICFCSFQAFVSVSLHFKDLFLQIRHGSVHLQIINFSILFSFFRIFPFFSFFGRFLVLHYFNIKPETRPKPTRTNTGSIRSQKRAQLEPNRPMPSPIVTCSFRAWLPCLFVPHTFYTNLSVCHSKGLDIICLHSEK